MPNLPEDHECNTVHAKTAHIPSNEINFIVTSGIYTARDALGDILGQLAPIALDPEETSTVELILAEVLNNIVEHAYPEGDPEGPIHLRCKRFADGLHFQIRDSGRMMPGGKAPVGQMQPYDVEMDDLPEGGFGWFLIQDLAKDVHYRRVGDENHLDLRIAVAYGPVERGG